jgi:3-oxoacid CoA-transferase
MPVHKSGLDSVPSKAEGVGIPATEKKKGKLWASADEAIKDLKSGSVVLSAGEERNAGG